MLINWECPNSGCGKVNSTNLSIEAEPRESMAECPHCKLRVMLMWNITVQTTARALKTAVEFKPQG